MDTESIRPLVSILIWGGFFFFMMRFGCGAHMMGGHGHHGGHSDSRDTIGTETKDPVCGMVVDPQKVTTLSKYLGKTYYFCSVSCREKFEHAPEKYVGAATGEAQLHAGHHHA